MKENVILEKSRSFGIRVVKMYQYLREEKREYVLSRQVLRSGTSIGANISEAQRGQSRADFYSKMCIAQKEEIETEYWLRLLYEGEYLSGREFESITRDLNEVLSLLHAICKKTRSNLNLA